MANPVEGNRKPTEGIRVLFAIGLTPSFYTASDERIHEVGEASRRAFDDLEERFGVRVLGTLDDDETMVGPTTSWPWTCYILAHAPDRKAVAAVCNELRETRIGDDARLWTYVKIEARLGRPLFFGNS